ncbi:cation diffusion facilitator family transporter [Luteibacter sp. UNCMF366Tsu5.1]|uniref:cation diffusion facilitator family transporter n=1 Tax=Luteibacter sp. UNCMF366Tsu5.1 TaxID=1502758 RepID=UPI00090894B8|nr:cation diffusion facilitator family transporter [Luteibacter sp. UNCMF366Tsu5.1]SFW17563.1 cobalt-zinc-cadmium efflux system protein [Luteibacter sp. UNCMF366Tsu5.1]
MAHDHTSSHGHTHSHDHAHDHAHVAGGSARKLLFAFVLTTLMMVAEAAGGLVSGSLALLADAGHMLVDALALLLAFIGASVAARPADARRTYGYGRIEVLAGFVNALTQFVLVAFIVYEAVQRLLEPKPILSGVMLVVAVFGLVINVVVLRTLHGHDPDDVNVAGASLHVLGDLLGSVAAVLAALAVRWLEWNWADPVLSILVSLLILRSAWSLVRRSGHILLEGTPEGVHLADVERELHGADEGIVSIHHVHIWQVTAGSRMATLHAELAAGAERADQARVLDAIKRMLSERWGVNHATVQFDPGPCPDETGRCGKGGSHVH